MTEAQWEEAFQTTLLSVSRLVRHAVPAMKVRCRKPISVLSSNNPASVRDPFTLPRMPVQSDSRTPQLMCLPLKIMLIRLSVKLTVCTTDSGSAEVTSKAHVPGSEHTSVPLSPAGSWLGSHRSHHLHLLQAAHPGAHAVQCVSACHCGPAQDSVTGEGRTEQFDLVPCSVVLLCRAVVGGQAQLSVVEH